MLFNPKKPFKIVEVTKGDYTCFHIQQPINFLAFTLWRTIKYRTVDGIYIAKAFDKLKNALNWIDEKKQPIAKNVVYDSRNFITDYKGLSRTVKQKNVQVKPISNTSTSSYVPPKPATAQNNQ